MRKLNLSQFVDRSNDVHHNFYDYSQSIFYGVKSGINIICPIHGLFNQLAGNHMRGDRCPSCTNNKKLDNNLFKEKIKLVHSDIYDYSLIEVENNKSKIKIICKIHGIFIQMAAKHLAGQGCPKCSIINNANNQKTKLNDFIFEANNIHLNKYIYDLVNYVNARTKITIICLDHGNFDQIPDNHLNGHGCPKCTSSVSKSETLWLDSLNIVNRNKSLWLNENKRIIFDGFDSITNTIYEFYGDYWHGNPDVYPVNYYNERVKKTAGELYQETIVRQNMILDAGYNLIYIWESDFKRLNNVQTTKTSISNQSSI